MAFVQLARFQTLEGMVGPLEEEFGLTTLFRILFRVDLIKYPIRELNRFAATPVVQVRIAHGAAYSWVKSPEPDREQKCGIDITGEQFSTDRPLTFMNLLQAKAKTVFVLDYVFKDACVENSLRRQKRHLSLEPKAGLITVQYNKDNDCPRQRSGSLLREHHKRFSFPNVVWGVPFI